MAVAVEIKGLQIRVGPIDIWRRRKGCERPPTTFIFIPGVEPWYGAVKFDQALTPLACEV